MKATPLFETPDQQKTNFLYNRLDCINAAMLKSGIYPAPESPEYNYDKDKSKQLVEQLCKELGLRGRGETIFIVNEDQSYQVEINWVPDILKSLKRELSIDWSKNKYEQKDPLSRWGFERVIRPIHRSSPLTKEYWHTMKPYELATMHDSLEDFKNDQDNVNCHENLQTAINGLQMLKQNNPSEKLKIKGLENMVKLWQSHCDPWDKALQIAEKTDYIEIAKVNEYQRVNKLAENNEAIKALKPQIDNITGHYINDRVIYDTFVNVGLEPVNDLDLYVSLVTANEIKNRKKEEWTRDAENNPVSSIDVLKYKSVEDYIQIHEADLKSRVIDFDEQYKLKKTGGYKSVSHRERERRGNIEKSIDRDTLYLNMVIKNEFTIKKYL